jgi:tRNA pseudouridine38-40 synthase
MKIALKFAYNGINYHGFARQPDINTIENKIIESLSTIGIIDNIKSSNFRYASRTDKGVSAFGNVIALDTNYKKDVLKKLKDQFEDIVFYGIKIVNPSFNPRYAKQRIYRYYFKKNKKKMEKIKKIIYVFKGKKDFSNFAKIEASKKPIKVIDRISIREREDLFYIDFYAQSYLWHQIRKIISAINYLINGKIDIRDLIYALNNPNEKVDYGLSPPEPLVLMDIIYDFNFKYYNLYLTQLKRFKNILLNEIKYHVY